MVDFKETAKEIYFMEDNRYDCKRIFRNVWRP